MESCRLFHQSSAETNEFNDKVPIIQTSQCKVLALQSLCNIDSCTSPVIKVSIYFENQNRMRSSPHKTLHFQGFVIPFCFWLYTVISLHVVLLIRSRS
jgi:hypothetical protein